MGRTFLEAQEKKALSRLYDQLTSAKRRTKTQKTVAINRSQLALIIRLLDDLLASKARVSDEEYLTPNQAAKIANVSRPVIIEMVKNGSLLGHKVNSHWRVDKRSLLDYIDRRRKGLRLVSRMDKDGFGF